MCLSLPQNKGNDLQGKGDQKRGDGGLSDSYGKIGNRIQNSIQAAQQIGVSVDAGLEKHDDKRNKEGEHFPQLLFKQNARGKNGDEGDGNQRTEKKITFDKILGLLQHGAFLFSFASSFS